MELVFDTGDRYLDVTKWGLDLLTEREAWKMFCRLIFMPALLIEFEVQDCFLSCGQPSWSY